MRYDHIWVVRRQTVNPQDVGRERRGVYRVLVGKPGERDHLGEQGADGRIILRLIFRKWDVGVWTGSSWLRIRTGGGHL